MINIGKYILSFLRGTNSTEETYDLFFCDELPRCYKRKETKSEKVRNVEKRNENSKCDDFTWLHKTDFIHNLDKKRVTNNTDCNSKLKNKGIIDETPMTACNKPNMSCIKDGGEHKAVKDVRSTAVTIIAEIPVIKRRCKANTCINNTVSKTIDMSSVGPKEDSIPPKTSENKIVCSSEDKQKHDNFDILLGVHSSTNMNDIEQAIIFFVDLHNPFQFLVNPMSVQKIIWLLKYPIATLIKTIQELIFTGGLKNYFPKTKIYGNRSKVRKSLKVLFVLLLLNKGSANEGNDYTTRKPVSVELITRPIQMGYTAKLDCNIHIEYFKVVSWTKIPDGESIVYQNISSNPFKYYGGIYIQQNVIRYSLLIKTFTLSDLNCKYRCDVDFHSDSITLDLHYFTAIPKQTDIEKNVTMTRGILTGNMIIHRIYPKPRCIAFFSGHNITNGLTIEYTQISILYQIRLILHAVVANCAGNIFVNCTLPYHSQSVLIEEDVKACEDTTLWSPSFTVVFITVISVLILVPIISICILKRSYLYKTVVRKRNDSVKRLVVRHNHKDTPTHQNTEEQPDYSSKETVM